ncbi:MAG: LCP family protein [Oscillospiraceae bacterium]|jgi:LCP family protein required for cell wall assembly|nr:LCP family protein [Oscillospiraceae bacterium]
MSFNSKKNHQDYGDKYNDDFTNVSSNSKKSKSKIKKTVINTVVICASLLSIVAGAVLIYTDKVLNSVNYESIAGEPSESQSKADDGSPLLANSSVLPILLVGTNEGLSDTNMLFIIDSIHKKLKLISFLRDTWVQIPGHGEERLNVAHSIGGGNLSVQTLQQNFGIKIDRYVSVNINGLEEIIDILGGMDIELTVEEVKYINTFSKDNAHTLPLKAGNTHLTGKQAVCHLRNRNSAGSDYDRTGRQRDGVEALKNKVDLGQLVSLISQIAPKITTNLTKDEIAKLASKAPSYKKYGTANFRLPTDDNVEHGVMKEGKCVEVIPDWEKAKDDLAKFISGEKSK